MNISMLPQNFQTKVVPVEDCWIWVGARNSKGYGSVSNGQGGSMLAHRASYEFLVGEIPDGLTIDHLCLNKLCLNPAHLEPVTAAENTSRRYRDITHCLRGHEYTAENTIWSNPKDGRVPSRSCRTCQNIKMRAYRRGLSIDEYLEMAA